MEVVFYSKLAVNIINSMNLESIIIAVGITEVFISETIILYTLQVQILALVHSIPKCILRVSWDLIQV